MYVALYSGYNAVDVHTFNSLVMAELEIVTVVYS